MATEESGVEGATSSTGLSDESVTESDSGAESDPEAGTGTEVDLATASACEPFEDCEQNNDIAAALGLGCDGSSFELSTNANALSVSVHSGVSGSDYFNPRSGSQIVVLSTGDSSEVSKNASVGGDCSVDAENPSGDPSDFLLAPVTEIPVAGSGDCLADPGLVGSGDCSGTLLGPTADARQSGGFRNAASIRMILRVPDGATGVELALSFLTCEYPARFFSEITDGGYVWVESSSWTGNVAFDDAGHILEPAVADLTLLDDTVELGACPQASCSAPELQGTMFEGHGATPWQRVTAPVTEGEDLELVVGLWESATPWNDSFILLDRVRWLCDEDVQPTMRPY